MSAQVSTKRDSDVMTRLLTLKSGKVKAYPNLTERQRMAFLYMKDEPLRCTTSTAA